MHEAVQTGTPDLQLFHDVFNASPIGIAVENLDGHLLLVNAAFCSFLGFSEEELRSKHCVDFSPPEDAEKDWALFQQLRNGSIDHYQLEKRYFRKDGSLVWGSLSISLLSSLLPPLVLAMVEDVTEKKRAEEARFRHTAIVESSEDAIASATLDGTILSWNFGAQRMFEYTESEMIGKSFTLIVPPERADEATKMIETLRAGERINQFETVRVSKTGKRINVSLTISPIKDSSGRTVGISGIARDITERKMAEHRLREYEEAVEGAEDMIGIVDRQYRYLLVNRQYLKMRNLTREQVVGHFITELVHKDLFETAVKPKLDECFQGAVVRYEMKFPYPTIGERDLLISYFPIQGVNGIDRVACILHDITDRKRAEEALRISAERLRLAQWAAHIGTFDLDMRTGVNTWTPETEALYGLPPGGFDGTLSAFENLVHPDDRQRVLDLARKTMRTGEATDAEWRTVWPDGSVHWIAGRGQLLRDESGEPWRLIGVNLDITESKRAEEALLGMTRKLVEAQEQERARIARELHDDITQRVALLAIEIEQLPEHCETPAELTERAHELATRAKEISSGVQSLSHELHSSTLALLGFEAGMKSCCREFGERQKLQIVFQSHKVPELPREISLCLFRVLQEALQNAAKHSGAKQIEVKLGEDSGEIRLIVSDSGKGFDIKAPGRSRGLGLTSMQERVRLIGGTILIESKPACGTTIHVRVPVGSERTARALAG